MRQKLIDIEEKDRIRNFQPPVTGDEIMRLFTLPPCREIGTLKSALKDAILDGKAENKPLAALNFVMERAQQMGLSANQEAYAEIKQQKETDEKALAETAG